MTLAAWLLTYALHSSLLLGLGALAIRALGPRRLAVQEAVLRTALWGGIATATLQVAAGVDPLAGSLSLARLEPASRPAASSAPPGPVLASVERGELAPAPESPGRARPARRPPPARGDGIDWLAALVVLWLVGALLGVARIVVAAARLRRLLAGGRPLAGGPIARFSAAAARRLGVKRPVELSASRRVAVPFASGVRRPAVCLPEWILDELPFEEQRGLCAHELAHLARRDPSWRGACRLVESVLFFQPLNRWARARLEELAESLSDDLAARRGGERLSLARSLVRVASVQGPVPEALIAVGALSSRSHLGRRVERLMSPTRLENTGLSRWPLGLVAALVAAVAVLPGASPASPVQDPAEERRDAPAPPAPARPAPPEALEPPPEPPPTRLPAAPAPATPAAAPLPPVPPAAPAAVEHDDDELEREIERRIAEIEHEVEAATAALTRRIELRAGDQEELEAEIEAEIEAIVHAAQPSEEELERLEAETVRIAEQIAEAEVGSQADPAAAAEARELARALRDQLRELAEQMRPSQQELALIRERARELAGLRRPLREEQLELQHLARELAERLRPLQEELRELARSSARRAREAARERRLQREQAGTVRQEQRERREQQRLLREQTERRQREERGDEEQRKPPRDSVERDDPARPLVPARFLG